MSLDPIANHVAAGLVECEDPDAFLERYPQATRRDPINYGDELARYLEDLGEQILIRRDELAVLEATYKRLQATPVDFDPDPGFTRRAGIDPRLFSVGTDGEEEWRPREDVLPRPWVDVAVGGDRL